MGLILHEVIDHWATRFPWDEERHPRPRVAERVMEAVMQRMRTAGKPLPGVPETIEFFRTRGLPLALASSSYEIVIEAALDALGLRPMFASVRSAQHEPFGKPHPGVFLAAAADLERASTACLVFEDSLNGLIAAKAARMKCVAVPDAAHRSDARFELADLRLDSLRDFDQGAWEGLA